MSISIHTPTKGVTKARLDIQAVHGISIHTPTKGVTASNRPLLLKKQISIHTPTKGVTSSGMMSSVLRAYFNPHSHEGSDDYRRQK